MRVPLSWLREQCDPALDATAIAERLDLTGTEVERIERVGVGAPERFVVGRVVSAAQHPDADRLRVCEVDDGSGEPRTIVCGAPNVAAGQTVAVALPGAVMPDGNELGEAQLRGVRSSGMILAEDELAIGDDHAGIMVLSEQLVPGSPLADALPIADEVLELEITPNRPDCLSVTGVARELHAATGAALGPDPADGDADPSGTDDAHEHVSVEVADPEICLRFTARVFEDVVVGSSPAWLKQRLIAAGQRPISNVVDITNYVMLQTGQPLHAFDLDRVRGARIVVRRAAPGERMTTLDDVERGLGADTALVCDAEGPSGIAGIMGGQISEVEQSTVRVLMEAATWVGPNILRSSKALGLRTEASARFEKQLHPAQALAGQRLAARLMVDLCGARLVPGTVDVYPEPAQRRAVTLRFERIGRLLGTDIPPGEALAILSTLGFEPAQAAPASGDAASAEILVPSWRDSDVQREADLIEEVARIYGFDRLPATLPARRRAVGRLTGAQRLRRRLEDVLRGRGLDEIVAWSFTSPEVLERLRLADQPALALANPLSEDSSVLRPLLLGGLLDAAARNAAHGSPGVALYESAHVYAPGGGAPLPAGSPRGHVPANERHHLGALLTPGAPGGWRSEPAPADFFAVKGLAEAVVTAAGLELTTAPAAEPFLHPGRSATAAIGSTQLGWIGELHPLVARGWEIEGAAAFELDLDALAAASTGDAAYSDLTGYPAVLQDIAVVAPQERSAGEIEAAVRRAGGELLAAVTVFDVYAGEQTGAGNRSLALRLTFRASDRTLTDDEVAERRAAIEGELETIGGRLRG